MDQNTEEIFFASMSFRKGLQAEMRSSTEVFKGQSIILMPVPEGWNGEKILPSYFDDPGEAIVANVNRLDIKGVFQIRILSGDEQIAVNMVRSGKTSGDNLKVDVVDAGMVATAVLSGNLGVKSVSTIQQALRKLPEDRRLIILDFREVAVLSKTGTVMLYTILKELAGHGFIMKSLTEPHGMVFDKLTKSRISEIAPIFHDRENAVASLLTETLDG